jgi:hypothetical protein
MKKFAIGLSILILLAIGSHGFSSLAQPSHIPHQNPVTAKDSPDQASLLLFYSGIFDLAAISQYQDAQNRLNELEYVNMPDELRYIIDRYNSLSQQLLTTMNNLESLLDEASTLFARDQTSDAKQKLNEAETTTDSALFLLEDIEAVTNILGDELGVFATAAGSEIRLAYEHQQGNLSRLRQLINELSQLRESLGLNPLMEIRTSFYHPTLLEVSAPETAYPGQPITISGQVSSKDDTIDRTLKVFLDNTQLAEETIQGQFSLQVTPPQQISTGKHSLTVVIIPYEHYSGASTSLTINIKGIPIQADIQIPQFVVIPKSIQVSGKVYHNLDPVQDARVSLAFRGYLTTVKTATDGSFTTTMKVPFDLSLIGPQELSITIEPVEPWYAPLQIEGQTFTINPASMGLTVVAFISLGLLLYNRVRVRTRPPGRREEMVTTEVIPQEPPTAVPPRPKYEFTSIKGRILSAYMGGLEVVERVTSIPMAPHTTFREFLNIISSQLPEAIKPFTELTIIAEIALYSAHRLDEDIAIRAEQLAVTIKEELYNGTA